MPRDPLILGFDTSAAHCAAALLSGDQIIASRFEEMKRGQAERLMPLLEELLSEADANWSDISRIGVGVGPGNFTGIRISVSAARGLAMGLNIQAIGVSLFETTQRLSDVTRTAIPAPRENAYYLDPESMAEPVLIPSAELDQTGAAFSSAFDGRAHAVAIAQIAAAATELKAKPKPLYIRGADAAPPSDPPPIIVP